MVDIKTYEHDREKWLKVIKSVGFNEKSFDKISDYLENHVRYELQLSIHKIDEYESTIPIALRVLRMLEERGLLDKIIFVTTPNGSVEINGVEYEYICDRLRVGFDFKELFDGNLHILHDVDYEMIAYSAFADETVKILENYIVKEGYCILFILFSNLVSKGTRSIIHHRYTNPKKIEENEHE
jgi:hypothetical protein